MCAAPAAGPPTGLARRLMRVPRWLYRFRLGWLLGHRLLLLTHRGRRTGRARQAVVEVVRYDPITRESVVFAAWRGETDWYRNIGAAPALRVQTGREDYAPQQRFLDDAAVERELIAYVARHPLVARRMLKRVFGLPVDGSDASLREAARFFRGVAFRPATAADGVPAVTARRRPATGHRPSAGRARDGSRLDGGWIGPYSTD